MTTHFTIDTINTIDTIATTFMTFMTFYEEPFFLLQSFFIKMRFVWQTNPCKETCPFHISMARKIIYHSMNGGQNFGFSRFGKLMEIRQGLEVC